MANVSIFLSVYIFSRPQLWSAVVQILSDKVYTPSGQLQQSSCGDMNLKRGIKMKINYQPLTAIICTNIIN